MFVRGLVLGGFGALLVFALVVAACGDDKRGGNGAECFVATDCQEPLVCVEQRDKSRKCSDNLDSVVGNVPPDGAVADSGRNDAAENDAEPEPDANTGEPPDTGAGDQ